MRSSTRSFIWYDFIAEQTKKNNQLPQSAGFAVKSNFEDTRQTPTQSKWNATRFQVHLRDYLLIQIQIIFFNYDILTKNMNFCT